MKKIFLGAVLLGMGTLGCQVPVKTSNFDRELQQASQDPDFTLAIIDGRLTINVSDFSRYDDFIFLSYADQPNKWPLRMDVRRVNRTLIAFYDLRRLPPSKYFFEVFECYPPQSWEQKRILDLVELEEDEFVQENNGQPVIALEITETKHVQPIKKRQE